MAKAICEQCLYAGNKIEFELNSAYCIECVCEHAMCPKCKTAYHTPSITE